MKIISPVVSGSGAFLAHKLIESGLENYKVIPYSRYLELFPPAIKFFNDRSADLIHAPVNYAVFSKVKDKPLVSTFHGFVLDTYIHKYVSSLHKIHYQTDLKWFIQKALNKSDVVTCVSKYLANMVREHLGYTGDIRILYNGIDVKKFVPETASGNQRTHVKVLYCGGPSRRKGADLIPAILDRLDQGIELVYTSGLTSKKQILRHSRAIFLGHISHEAMPVLYHDVDILLSPTAREGFGLSVVEAMACGLSVVTTDCSSLPELVDDEKGGYLCEPGNVDMFADRINTLAQSPRLRREMGEYNRQKVVEKFTVDRMVGEYKNLFEEILA